MNHQMKQIIEDTKNEWKLDNFTLKEYHFFQENIQANEPSFILSMTWIPNETTKDEELSETGTISIELDLNSKQLRHMLFVNNQNDLDDTLFPDNDTETIIEWIEEHSGLEFGRQFKLIEDSDNERKFHAAVDNISVFPSGSIQIKFNEDGKLCLFSIDGIFPDESQLNWEPFSLTTDITEPIVRNQIQLIEIPSEEEEKWVPVFAMSSVFITNDGKETLTFKEVEQPGSYIAKDLVLRWTEPKEEKFSTVEVEPKLEFTEEEVFGEEPIFDKNEAITKEEQQKINEEVIQFLQMDYPQDSAKWRLSALWRDAGYIFAKLLPVKRDAKVIERKITICINPETLKVMNYLDTESLLKMYDLEHADMPKMTEEEALETLLPNVDILPTYVYNHREKQYQLCGKLDASYGVHAVTGELMSLDE